MEEIMKRIEIFQNLKLICMVGMLFFLILSIILFRKFQMKEVFQYYKRQFKMRILGIILFSLCGGAFFIFGIQTEASQIPENGEEVEEEPEIPEETIPEDKSPILKYFLIKSGSEQPEDVLISDDGVTFYAKNLKDVDDIQIETGILDEAETFDGTRVLVEYKTLSDELWTALVSETQEWTSNEQGIFHTVYTFEGTENDTDTYIFRISYVDTSENPMILDEGTDVIEENETFISAQKIVIDKKSPLYQEEYTSETGEVLNSNEDGESLQPYYNAAKEIYVKLSVIEDNLDMKKTSITVSALDRNGKLISQEKPALENQIFSFKLNASAHYIIDMTLRDMAGNETIYKKTFALDYDAPKDTEIKYTIENGSVLQSVVNQLTFGYFAKEKVTVYVSMKDEVSGVDKLNFTYTDVDTAATVTETVSMEQDDIDKTLAKTVTNLPVSFKGNLKVYASDKLGNTMEELKDIGIIIESEEIHEKNSSASLEVTDSYSKTPGYYKDNVSVRFKTQDTYSGVRTISYRAGTDWEENVSYKDAQEIVTTEILRKHTILAAENNENNILTSLEFTDNAGHFTKVSEEELPQINIDITKPEVSVKYDNYDALNGKYYKEPRIAAIYVTERNFDPEDVHFEISGSDVLITDWEHLGTEGCTGGEDAKNTGHTDQCVWKCTVKFEEDGDYRFGFYCVDLAGNEGRYEHEDEFVIDRTLPVVKVDYDNHDVRNEYYYMTPRTGYITVEERNFDPDDVEISVSGVNENGESVDAQISGWSSNGDLHRAAISYDYDAIFSFDISFTDLAGNEASDYSTDYFVIDLTAPEIVINGVENSSANNGAVLPVITVTDTNYSGVGTWTTLTGLYNGDVEISKKHTAIQNGEMIAIQDLEHVRENDDLYILTIGTSDLAGNLSEMKISFSVNRFGSVYTFDKKTESLAGENGSYYTVQEIPLTVTETNVDTLEFKEIICSLNGKLRTLQEGEDYIVRESGDETSWKQYRYFIKAENFREEGHYTLTIYSEDRAKNVSDNHSKGMSLNFAVDKTAPSILVSGIEEQGRYRESSRKIILDIQDNIGISQVRVLLDGEEYQFDERAVGEVDGKIVLNVENKNEWQTLEVYAIDKAGNENSSKKIKFLISPDFWVQFYQNRKLFYGSIGITFPGCIAAVGLIIWKNGKKGEDSKKSS